MDRKQKRALTEILVTAVLFAALFALDKAGVLDGLRIWMKLILYAVPYLLIGHGVLRKAAVKLIHGQAFDENFLMTVATAAAFAIGAFPEATAVMLFYQIGELFQSYAVGKSRASIAEMMSIAPEYANLETADGVREVDPDDVEVGSVIVVRAGEKIPLDGEVIEGTSFLDTSALTGESVPRRAAPGDAVVSGCVNGEGTLRVRTAKRYEDSTVSRILELVENASSKKARLENFITRFARWYTPVVTVCAVLLAVIPPLVTRSAFAPWIHRACIFLIVSCPCALVISVPLGFFGGIGAASRLGVLVKGSNYLEAMSQVTTAVFDKTGTLTRGEFRVSGVFPAEGVPAEELLTLAAHGEGMSTHPIARSIREAYGKAVDPERIGEVTESAGRGIRARVDGRELLLGSARLLADDGIAVPPAADAGTVVHAACGGRYLGRIVISDEVKPGAREALSALRGAGVRRTVMLSGDRQSAAGAVGEALGIDRVCAELLPAEKVEQVEALLAAQGPRERLAYVGDGINDAPVLMRADVGIAMGTMGSDAAIEAADVVLMDDDLGKLAVLVRIARKTVRIVRENVVFALAVKFLVLALGALGLVGMWAAVFGDVGVTVIAILNAMRMLARSGGTRPFGKTE
ncbi:MAG: cadmium-translocating P-type ATPase [Oscillospiraceae bacterium]|nr:cadmium-translocating P-type ATPase [Oscillospiraceae bacterium]